MQRNRKDLYTVGFPRSGNTWLSRLLGDALNSPVQSRKNNHAIGDEGEDRVGNYIIRQEHLDKKKYAGERPIILIVRDPRDTAVSVWKYWQIESLLHTVRKMHKGKWPITHGGGWSNFYDFWLDTEADYLLKYEDLLSDTRKETERLLQYLGEEPAFPLDEIILRQSFGERKKLAKKYGDLMPYGKAVQESCLRRGIAGDWQNHFDRELELIAKTYFGETAAQYGYNLKTRDERRKEDDRRGTGLPEDC